jgi:hypothetical protein
LCRLRGPLLGRPPASGENDGPSPALPRHVEFVAPGVCDDQEIQIVLIDRCRRPSDDVPRIQRKDRRLRPWRAAAPPRQLSSPQIARANRYPRMRRRTDLPNDPQSGRGKRSTGFVDTDDALRYRALKQPHWRSPVHCHRFAEVRRLGCDAVEGRRGRAISWGRGEDPCRGRWCRNHRHRGRRRRAHRWEERGRGALPCVGRHLGEEAGQSANQPPASSARGASDGSTTPSTGARAVRSVPWQIHRLRGTRHRDRAARPSAKTPPSLRN